MQGSKFSVLFGLFLCFGGTFTAETAQAAKPELWLLKTNQATVQSISAQTDLEAQAQELYLTGEYQAAIALLDQLAATYAQEGDHFSQAMALRNQALVYQEMSDWEKANDAIAIALERLNILPNSRDRAQLFAQILDVQGQIQLSLGQSEQALETWKQAKSIYESVSDLNGVTRAQLNQTQALKALGLYSQALETLQNLQAQLNAEPDSLMKAKGLQTLGDALRAVGYLKQSEEVLTQSLAIAQRLQTSEEISAVLISLGNTAWLQSKPDAALNFYQRAIAQTSNPTIQLQAQLNQLSLLVTQKQWSQAESLVPQIQSQLNTLSPSRSTIYARINFARSLLEAQQNQSRNAIATSSEIGQVLATAVQQAQTIDDQRAQAYALGNLGKLYEQNQQWNDAKALTEKALLLAQATNAADIAYQWQWQLGRILKVQGDREGAITAYSQAVDTLQSLRSDLVAISSDVQFSFRKSVEPVYREFVSLLLPSNSNVDQKSLSKARQVIESLQLAELDNFFRDACLDAQPVQIDQIDQKAAIFYPIILSDRVEVIVALPNQPLLHYTATNQPQAVVENTIQQIRDALTIPRYRLSIRRFLEPSQIVYDWLIRPIEADLGAANVETLVFVLDGAFRNIPIASLYDGQQYIAEKYSIGIAPGLQLVNPTSLSEQNLTILAAGLTESRLGFSALPNVELELDQIKTELPTQQLLNQSFTESNFKELVKSFPFPVVHLATHGEFSSEAEDTFILTWDQRINANELNNLLRNESQQTNPIELLVLSACQTAAGDDRAALGLAGVAVRAGARSTLASLWYVSDEATALLMTEFYQQLARNNVTKSEALRAAQKALLNHPDFAHPYFWSAFVLVGNWL